MARLTLRAFGPAQPQPNPAQTLRAAFGAIGDPTHRAL